MNPKTLKALNDQIVKEYYSAYLYLSMAAYLESQDLPGFAKWMRTQAQEELAHGTIFFYYVADRGPEGKIPALGALGRRC